MRWQRRGDNRRLLLGHLESVSWLYACVWGSRIELLLRAVWVGPVRVDVSVRMALCRHDWTRLERCFGVLVPRGAAIAQLMKFRSLLLKVKLLIYLQSRYLPICDTDLISGTFKAEFKK